MRVALVGALLLCAASASGQVLTRGPYLQLGAPTGVTIVFRTDRPGLGRLRFGLEGQPLSGAVADQVPQSEHVFRLSGLTPGTSYAYALDLDGQPLFTPAPLRFRTHPLPGVAEPFRLFAWGDSGTATPGQFRVAQRMANELNGAAFALILGDLIYPDGHPLDYDPKFFQPYAPLTSRMVIWPVVGNHDVAFDPSGQPWLDAFHTPANNPSFTELYYSFDYANAHVVVLDTHVNSFSASSLQMQWAAADLAASSARWKIAAFHVPPFSGGTHSDDFAVQAGILPVLEAAGVDLVLSGHSHVYERTFLLNQGAIVEGDAASYSKLGGGLGTLYVVSGTAGQSGGLSNPAHPLMAFQLGGTLGVSVFDFADDVVRGFFLRDDGSTVDAFQLTKGNDNRAPRLVAARAIAPTVLEAVFDEPVVGGTSSRGAERVATWVITPPIAVTGATLASDLRTVRLVTAPHPGGIFRLAAPGVADRALPPNLSGTDEVSYAVRTPIDAGSPSAVSSLPDAGVLLVGPLTPVRHLVGAPPLGWQAVDFDDGSWEPGWLPIGYGEPGARTTIAAGTVTLAVRQPFDLELDPAEVRSLTLELDYDDGVVVSLNGAELVRRGVTGQALAAPHESGLVELVALEPSRTLLRPGANVLAVEVRNTAPTSSDLWLDVRLWANAVIEPPDGGARPNDDPDAGDDGGAALDAGVDAGPTDAGLGRDAGDGDAGLGDAGALDAGGGDGGDGREADGGPDPMLEPPCGCQTNPLPTELAALALLLLLARRGVLGRPVAKSRLAR